MYNDRIIKIKRYFSLKRVSVVVGCGLDYYFREFLGFDKMFPLGKTPAIVVKRNIRELCRSEWGTREMGWSLEPITGILASEHSFIGVYGEDDSCDINQIDVHRRGDSSMNVLFHISACGADIGIVSSSDSN